MDETRIDDRIDDTYQEDGTTDYFALLPPQYTLLRTLHSPSSPTRSPLHLASLSSDPLGSPHSDDIPNTSAVGLGISSVSSSSLCDSVRDELLRELRQELFVDM
jgi:hypothetical protein